MTQLYSPLVTSLTTSSSSSSAMAAYSCPSSPEEEYFPLYSEASDEIVFDLNPRSIILLLEVPYVEIKSFKLVVDGSSNKASLFLNHKQYQRSFKLKNLTLSINNLSLTQFSYYYSSLLHFFVMNGFDISLICEEFDLNGILDSIIVSTDGLKLSLSLRERGDLALLNRILMAQYEQDDKNSTLWTSLTTSLSSTSTAQQSTMRRPAYIAHREKFVSETLFSRKCKISEIILQNREERLKLVRSIANLGVSRKRELENQSKYFSFSFNCQNRLQKQRESKAATVRAYRERKITSFLKPTKCN